MMTNTIFTEVVNNCRQEWTFRNISIYILQICSYVIKQIKNMFCHIKV